MMGAVKSYLNESGVYISELAVKPVNLAGLIKLVEAGSINNTVASHKLFPAMIKSPEKSSEQLAAELNLLITNDSDDVRKYIQDALSKFPDKVKEYHKGKKGVLGLFMGDIMKSSKRKDRPPGYQQIINRSIRTIEMKIKALAYGAIAAVTLLAACKDESKFKIEGTVKNLEGAKKVYLLEADSTQINVVDSVAVGADGKFEIKHSTPFENLYKLRVGTGIYDLIAKNGETINFTADQKDKTGSYEITGSDNSAKIQEFNKISSEWGSSAIRSCLSIKPKLKLPEKRRLNWLPSISPL